MGMAGQGEFFAAGGAGLVGALGGGYHRASWDAGGMPRLIPRRGFGDRLLSAFVALSLRLAGSCAVLCGCPTL